MAQWADAAFRLRYKVDSFPVAFSRKKFFFFFYLWVNEIFFKP